RPRRLPAAPPGPARPPDSPNATPLIRLPCPLESHPPLTSQEWGPGCPLQPSRCDIDAVITVTMSHRDGYVPGPDASNEAEVTCVAQPSGTVDTIPPHP